MKPVISHEYTIGKGEMLHPDGLFSEPIFGLKDTPDRKKNYSFIELGCVVLHPALYNILKRLNRKLVEAIESILGTSPKHTKEEETEAHRKRIRKAEEERKHKEEEAAENLRKAKAVRKAEEERKHNEKEAKRRAEEEQKRKKANALKLGILAGVAVLLMVGILWYSNLRKDNFNFVSWCLGGENILLDKSFANMMRF